MIPQVLNFSKNISNSRQNIVGLHMNYIFSMAKNITDDIPSNIHVYASLMVLEFFIEEHEALRIRIMEVGNT